MIVKLEHINFGYKRNKLLFNDLSFGAEPGSIYGLLGKNGAGKTSLLKIIIGLREIHQGKSEVFGFNPFDRKRKFLEQVFLVPEDFVLPSISISRYLHTCAGFYPTFDLSLFKECMGQFELDMQSHLGHLSYGQKKKFLVSFAIATGVNLILFDEPTNGMDIPSKSVFRKLAASTVTDERTFIISTHQVRDLNTLIDSLIMVEKGQIVLNSTIAEITEKYAFVILPRKHGRDDLLYTEEHLEGIKAIVPNCDGLDTFVDLELLFNAKIFKKI